MAKRLFGKLPLAVAVLCLAFAPVLTGCDGSGSPAGGGGTGNDIVNGGGGTGNGGGAGDNGTGNNGGTGGNGGNETGGNGDTGTGDTGGGGPSAFVMVAAGLSHTLAICEDGKLWAWGNRSFGRLGTGGAVPSGNETTPIQVGTHSDWVHVAAGDQHSLGIREDETTGNRTLWAWGPRQFGRLGTGATSSNQTTPIQVGTDTDWLYVSAGRNFSVGIRGTDLAEGGQMWAWGYGASGRLGQGTGITANRYAPVRVGTGSDWISVSAGESYTLGIRGVDRRLYSWGVGAGGNYGLGTGATVPQNRYSLAPIGSIRTGWTQVSAGMNHSLGIRAGYLYAWGAGTNGRLGTGNENRQLAPTRIGAASDWETVSAGRNHSMGIRAGYLYAWGANAEGRTGLGTTGNTYMPTRVGTQAAWTGVSTGASSSTAQSRHSVGIRAGKVYTWGYNGNGRTGHGTADGYTPVPTLVSFPAGN